MQIITGLQPGLREFEKVDIAPLQHCLQYLIKPAIAPAQALEYGQIPATEAQLLAPATPKQ
ncbi:hypothetical protein D3C77_621860 [compost metagenome]